MENYNGVCCRYYPSCACADAEDYYRLETQKRRTRIILVILGVVTLITLVGLVAGCDPTGSVPDKPVPTTSVMYTVIKPEG